MIVIQEINALFKLSDILPDLFAIVPKKALFSASAISCFESFGDVYQHSSSESTYTAMILDGPFLMVVGRFYIFSIRSLSFESCDKPKKIIPIESIEGEFIAKGREGAVYEHSNNSSLVIKKSFNQSLAHEYHIGKKLSHPSIVKMKRLCDDRTLVMEKIEGTTISSFCIPGRRLNDNDVRRILQQGRDCSLHLFDQEVIWADLTEDNLFITNERDLKICDLGFWMNLSEWPDKIGQDTPSSCLGRWLLLGGMDLTRKVIRCSEKMRLSSNPINLEMQVTLPATLFPDRGCFPYRLSYIEYYYQSPWVTKILNGYKDREKELLRTYFTHAISTFCSISEGQT